MEKQNNGPTHVYNFNGSVGQFIEHVDTVNFKLEGDGKFHFSNVEKVTGQQEKPAQQPVQEPTPVLERKATKEMMNRAMLNTLIGGYWKSGRSWGIVLAVYQIWGYQGRVNDFLDEVKTWPDIHRNRFACNRDAATKLSHKYNLSKDLKNWKIDGVPEQYCILGEKLNGELEKMRAQQGA